LTGPRAERAFPRSTQAKWIAEDTFLHYVFQDIVHGKIDVRDLFSELSGQRIYGIFAWSDPLPFVRYSLTVGLLRFGQKIFKELRSRTKPDHAVVLALSLCHGVLSAS
jgi:hypothetical protein